MTKINIMALRGFNLADPKARTDALAMEGDENVLTFTKRAAYAGWTTDETKIITEDGETTVGEENVRQMQRMLGQWLRGEEIDF
jgi:hypothetical protein